jgi:GGDEF domain-containing protein
VYLDNYSDYRETLGEERLGGVLEGLSALIREAVRSHDIIGRLSENSVAVIALEMNRRQTSYTSSKLQDKIAQFLKRESDIVPQLTIKIAESPIDGISADALLAAAGVKIG